MASNTSSQHEEILEAILATLHRLEQRMETQGDHQELQEEVDVSHGNEQTRLFLLTGKTKHSNFLGSYPRMAQAEANHQEDQRRSMSCYSDVSLGRRSQAYSELIAPPVPRMSPLRLQRMFSFREMPTQSDSILEFKAIRYDNTVTMDTDTTRDFAFEGWPSSSTAPTSVISTAMATRQISAKTTPSYHQVRRAGSSIRRSLSKRCDAGLERFKARSGPMKQDVVLANKQLAQSWRISVHEKGKHLQKILSRVGRAMVEQQFKSLALAA